MTVKELKELLETLPENWEVSIFEGGEWEDPFAYASDPKVPWTDVKLF